MHGRDLYVFQVTPAVRVLVFDPKIRELDAVVYDRQVVLDRPLLDFFTAAIRPPVTVGAVAISLLQELLVLALQFVIEDDALDARALRPQLLRRSHVRPTELSIVREFTALDRSGVKRLRALAIAAAMTLQEFASAFR